MFFVVVPALQFIIRLRFPKKIGKIDIFSIVYYFQNILKIKSQKYVKKCESTLLKNNLFETKCGLSGLRRKNRIDLHFL